MRALRIGLTIGVTAALAGGYAASQWAYLHGDAAAYAVKADSPPVRAAALAVLGLAVVLAVVRDRDDREGS